MSDREKASSGIDPKTPSIARMYDYYLGGKDNFAADREAAEKIIELFPHARNVARENRAFLGRAVRMLSESGVHQFIDIGTGLPTRENVHQIALEINPDARVVYVDNDPIVLTHARALLADNPQTIVIEGDLNDPKAILEHPNVRAHIDVGKPFAIVLCAVVHFVDDDDDASRVVSFLRRSLSPGGALVLSHGHRGGVDKETLAKAREIYSETRGTLKLRDRETILEYFSGLELVEPGLVPVEAWRPDYWPTPAPSAPSGLAAVGVAPLHRA